MTAAPWAAHEPETGCVLERECGVLVVLTDDGQVRASYGARMLGAIARDATCAPHVGEWVILRRWPDGPVTVERVVHRAPTRQGLADVISMRPLAG